MTNPQGDVTTTSYVPASTSGAGQVATTVDNPVDTGAGAGAPDTTTTYTYDQPNGAAAEHRGLVTGKTITRGGKDGGTSTLAWTASYDARGQLTTQHLPGQITQVTSYDPAGNPDTLTYLGQVTPVTESTDPDGNTIYTPSTPQPDQPWLSWSLTHDTSGRIRAETTGQDPGFDGLPGVTNPADVSAPTVARGIGYQRTYAYDPAGGVPIEVVQMILGHSSPSITRRVYAHVMKRATAEQVEKASQLVTQHRGVQSVSNSGPEAVDSREGLIMK